MLRTWKLRRKRGYSSIETFATSTFTRLFIWISLSRDRDRHQFFAYCGYLLVVCNFARFHGIWLRNKVARARTRVMNEFPRGPTTTPILVTSSSIQKWLWPGLVNTRNAFHLQLVERNKHWLPDLRKSKLIAQRRWYDSSFSCFRFVCLFVCFFNS